MIRLKKDKLNVVDIYNTTYNYPERIVIRHHELKNLQPTVYYLSAVTGGNLILTKVK